MSTTDRLSIRQYALAHKLDPNVIAEIADEMLADQAAQPVTINTLLPVPELDSLAETIDDTATEDLKDALEGVEAAREDLTTAEANLRRSVREALADGVQAVRVAEVLGVSRARVYQLRDGRR